MPFTVAKEKSNDGKRKPGRPPKGVETDTLSCRASIALVTAFRRLARATGATGPSTQLLRAAEEHIVFMYRTISADPESGLLKHTHVPAFLEAAETFLKEAGRWPLPEAS